MDLQENLQSLSKRVSELKENILTEEATKNAFVMPFIQLLGYDVFNPIEVIPEFVADIGEKKGEKVDYCIQKDGEPIIIIECKNWKQDLNLHNTQLERYFGSTNAKFAILTNGIIYRFYTDIEQPNKMDRKPFLELDLEKLKENAINELTKFHKKSFDVAKISDAAGELKYYNEIKQIYQKELQEPSDELVKVFASQVYSGRFTEKVLNQFRKIVKKALNHKINEIINERLTSALAKESNEQDDKKEEEKELPPEEKILYADEEKGIYTTQEEMNAYEVVVDILTEVIDKERIAYRDTKSYMGVLLDDNNRQPICRLRFNSTQKYLSVFDENKDEQKIPIDKVEHVYKYADKIIDSLRHYL